MCNKIRLERGSLGRVQVIIFHGDSPRVRSIRPIFLPLEVATPEKKHTHIYTYNSSPVDAAFQCAIKPYWVHAGHHPSRRLAQHLTIRVAIGCKQASDHCLPCRKKKNRIALSGRCRDGSVYYGHATAAMHDDKQSTCSVPAL